MASGAFWDGTHTSGSSTAQVVGNLLTGGSGADIFTFHRVVGPTSAIVGGWYRSNQPNPGDLDVLDFLPNGTYLLGFDPPSSSSLEFGSYSWNPTTGAFQFHVIDTTNPDAGFNGATIPSIDVNGNTITIHAADGTVVGLAVAAVPEPETWSLLLVGIGVIGVARSARYRKDRDAVTPSSIRMGSKSEADGRLKESLPTRMSGDRVRCA